MYCTIQDIENDMTKQALIEASNDVDASSNVNEKLVNAKILEISQKIDSYLNSRYTTPITDISSLNILRPICISLVVCDLYQRRYSLDYPPTLEDRRKSAIKDLEKLQKGIINLVATVPNENRVKLITVTKKPRVFTDDILGMY